jgi:hypothetical protein
MTCEDATAFLLLALPDACLLAVLQCCAADDQRSVLNAARAHSRLHQAAVLALRSITAVVAQQQRADSVLVYVKHCPKVDSISIDYEGNSAVVLRPLLPQQLQLHSLQLYRLQLQLGDSLQDMLGGAELAALKQLRLQECSLLDTAATVVLAAALGQLPAGLEHLSISIRWLRGQRALSFPTAVL